MKSHWKHTNRGRILSSTVGSEPLGKFVTLSDSSTAYQYADSRRPFCRVLNMELLQFYYSCSSDRRLNVATIAFASNASVSSAVHISSISAACSPAISWAASTGYSGQTASTGRTRPGRARSTAGLRIPQCLWPSISRCRAGAASRRDSPD